jgi:hypothetical protein
LEEGKTLPEIARTLSMDNGQVTSILAAHGMTTSTVLNGATPRR